MKTITIIILLSFGIIIACSTSKEDIAKKNFQASLFKQLNDPSSYVFVSIDTFSTYSKWDSISEEILTIKKEISNEFAAQQADSISLAATQALINIGYGDNNYFKKIDNYTKVSKANILKLNTKIKALNFKLKDATLKDTIVEYRTNIQFRSKNAFGALMLDTAYVIFDKDLNVKSINPNKLKLEF